MNKEILQTWNNEKVELHISNDGYCFCPVCGVKSKSKEWRPYDKKGHPSYDICYCGFEFGVDDTGEPPFEISWTNYRNMWLINQVENQMPPILTFFEKKKQLRNIGA